MEKECILYDNKICDNCGECNMCDLDPKKVCDSCGACLESEDEYSTIDVDLTYESGEEPEMLSFEEMFPGEAFGGDRNWDDEEDEDYDDEEDYFEDDEYYTDDDETSLGRDFGELFGG